MRWTQYLLVVKPIVLPTPILEMVASLETVRSIWVSVSVCKGQPFKFPRSSSLTFFSTVFAANGNSNATFCIAIEEDYCTSPTNCCDGACEAEIKAGLDCLGPVNSCTTPSCDSGGGGGGGGGDSSSDSGGGGTGCFSESSVVEVLGKGYVQMSNLEIGDAILTGISKQEHSPVYAFGHHSKNAKATFYQITTTKDGSPLEMTGEHLVFVQGKVNPVRADSVQIGDILLGNSGSGAAVSAVSMVEKKGLYAPLTASGSLLVNGVVASSYVALQDADKEYSQITGGGSQINVLSHNAFAHLYMTPFRFLCMGVSEKLCQHYDSEGIPQPIGLVIRTLKTFGTQSVTVQVLFFSFTMPLLAALLFAEKIFGASIAPVVILLIAMLLRSMYAKRTQKSKGIKTL